MLEADNGIHEHYSAVFCFKCHSLLALVHSKITISIKWAEDLLKLVLFNVCLRSNYGFFSP